MKAGYGYSRAPVVIAAIYLVVSVLWILFSDRLLMTIVSDPAQMTMFQTYKGMGFVIITALLLYLLIRSPMKKLLKSQAHLSQAEEKLRLTFESLSEGVVVIDLDGNIREINEAVLRMYGTDNKNDISGHQMHDFIAEQDHARLKEDVARTLAEGESGVTEFVLRRKDGSEFPGELCASVLKDASGEPVGIVAIIEDITERKEADQALRESEARYRTVLDSMMEGCQIIGFAWRYLYINDAAVRHGRRNREELLGRTMTEAYPGIENTEMFTGLKRCMEKRVPVRMENLFNFPDGSHGWFALSIEPVPEGIFILSLDITERKQAEQALKDSEERYRLLAENAQDLIYRIRLVPEQKFEYVSPSAINITGYTPEEHYADPELGYKIVHPDDRPLLAAVAQHPERYHKEPVTFRWVRKDGTIIWTEQRNTPIYDASGNVIALEGIARDITQRKRGEEHIRNLNEVLRALRGVNQLITREKDRERLIRQSCDLMVETRGFLCAWILLFDEQRKYVSAAVAGGKEMRAFHQQLEQGSYPPCIERILAHTDALAICSDILEKGHDCLPQGHHGEGQGFISRLEYEGKVYGVVSVYVPSYYALDPEEQSLFRELAGDIAYALSNIEKEEERKREEQKLRDSEEKYRSLFENMHNGLAYCQIIVDDNNQPVDFIYLEVNDAFEKLTGLKKEAVLGRKVTEAIPETREAHPEIFSIYGKVALTGEPAEFEIHFEPLQIWLAISVYSPQRGYFVAIFENITERKKMQEQLMVTDRLASIGELASGIAHELNNPLTGIIGLSEIVLDADVPPEVKEDMKTINSEAQRTARIVHNLLTFARKQPEEKHPANVNDAIAKVLELRAYEQKVSNINVITHLAPDLPEIIGNSFQLQQVFLNIIINAEYFMTEAHGKGTLTIKTKQAGDLVRISIVDDGPGITKETLRHIFDPFFTTKEVGKGTGLGLSLCHGIVTEHGGRIYAESEVGKGVTFIIELPAAPAESIGAEK